MGCGTIGSEGTQSEATEQSREIEIPAYPVLRSDAATNIECQLGIVALALNGVAIYAGAVDSQCNLVDPNDSTSEWVRKTV